MTILHANARDEQRAARIAAIRDGAITRAALGQGATYRRLPSGAHEVSIGGATTTAATLAEAIELAREGRP